MRSRPMPRARTLLPCTIPSVSVISRPEISSVVTTIIPSPPMRSGQSLIPMMFSVSPHVVPPQARRRAPRSRGAGAGRAAVLVFRP